MKLEGDYRILVKDDKGEYSICVREPESGAVAKFVCAYAADKYAKKIGIRSDYAVKR